MKQNTGASCLKKPVFESLRVESLCCLIKCKAFSDRSKTQVRLVVELGEGPSLRIPVRRGRGSCRGAGFKPRRKRALRGGFDFSREREEFRERTKPVRAPIDGLPDCSFGIELGYG